MINFPRRALRCLALFAPLSALADAAADSPVLIQQRNIEISAAQGQLTHYPVALCQLQNVETLSLMGHSFAEVPDCVAQNGRTLRQLRLSNNGISKASAATFQLRFLELLDLSNNKLTLKASDDWSGLTKLSNLFLNNNPTAELPSSIGQISTLEVLSLVNTQITTLPDSFANLTSLRVLDLTNTKIVTTPKAFAGMVNLEQLNLTGVTTLPPGEKAVIAAIFKGRATKVTYSP